MSGSKSKQPDAPSAVALRQARERLGLPQTRACHILGLSASSLVEAENGRWIVSESRLAEFLERYAMTRGVSGHRESNATYSADEVER